MTNRKKVFTGLLVSGVLAIVLMMAAALYAHGNLDSWIGAYRYMETYLHPSGEMYYTTTWDITIWKHDNKYYAMIEGDGWQLATRELASVSGNGQQIDILAMQTLPGDRSYGQYERYEKGEVLVHFERKGDALITDWKALRDQHPILTDKNDSVTGDYFEKVEMDFVKIHKSDMMTVDETVQYLIQYVYNKDYFPLCTKYYSSADGPLLTLWENISYPAYEFDMPDRKNRVQVFCAGETETGEYLDLGIYIWEVIKDTGQDDCTYRWHPILYSYFLVNRITKEVVQQRAFDENGLIYNTRYYEIFENVIRCKDFYE